MHTRISGKLIEKATKLHDLSMMFVQHCKQINTMDSAIALSLGPLLASLGCLLPLVGLFFYASNGDNIEKRPSNQLPQPSGEKLKRLEALRPKGPTAPMDEIDNAWGSIANEAAQDLINAIQKDRASW